MTIQSIVKQAMSDEPPFVKAVITITNQKGGVGKTSTAFNFAHYLNELGYRVATIDQDGQGNMTELLFEQDALDQYVHTTALDLFSADCSFSPLIHPSGIHHFATRRNSHDLNNIDTMPLGVADAFMDNLDRLKELYDFIVIDTPPTPGVRTTAACAAASYIFAPVLMDTFAESALSGVYSSVESIGQLLGVEIAISGVLINRWNETDADAVQDFNSLASQIGDVLIPTPVRASKVYVRAQRMGVPVWHIRRSGNEQRISRETRKAYGEMAGRIAEIPAGRIKAFNQISKAVRAKLAQSA